jgi:hypothetical protein
VSPSTIVAAAVLCAVVVAVPAAGAAERVAVELVDPQRFTDVRDAAMATDAGMRTILDELARFLRERGERDVPAGQRLVVRVTDVDLAGDFEPWRGPQFTRLRFMRETEGPRIELEFRLTDAGGRVVREGRRSLVDPNYLMRSQQVSDDPLRYEKALLAAWLREELVR